MPQNTLELSAAQGDPTQSPRQEGVDFPNTLVCVPDQTLITLNSDAKHLGLDGGGLHLVGEKPGFIQAPLHIGQGPVDSVFVGPKHPNVVHVDVAG